MAHQTNAPHRAPRRATSHATSRHFPPLFHRDRARTTTWLWWSDWSR
eukprot:CAMPEP_0182556782 /NCGR_PEP_ID=MMETSP1324-20130603/937_1 /TAXON_ID=236786 /ORGANISM="Florenciella sp., Strain RCC1587" /LENGTH=46 /DNA_ID= /DNA_START= /DNA_END= /DNA_ORIENTATION=